MGKNSHLFISIFAILLLLTGCVTTQDETKSNIYSEDSVLIQKKNSITTFSIDSNNKHIAVAFNRKFIKYFDIETGKLIKTFEPPTSKENECNIYSVAFSPDGKTIAAGGWTGFEWEKAHAIYLFNVETGVFKWRIGGLPSTILSLSYSKNGDYLTATLSGKLQGIRMFRTSDYLPVSKDRSYYGSSYSVDFANNGMMVSSSKDGYIRLYDKNLAYKTKTKVPGGKHPHIVSFSNDGTKISVGYTDSSSVDILSGKNLSLINSSNTIGVNNGTLEAVIFSNDGRFLYGGGRYRSSDGKISIRKWAKAGFGRFKDFPVSDYNIVNLLPLKSGGVVFGTAEPAFGYLDHQGKTIIHKINID